MNVGVQDYPSWTDEFKEDLKDLALASMDTFQVRFSSLSLSRVTRILERVG